eukprot:2019894-Amphidinium_carterae.1
MLHEVKLLRMARIVRLFQVRLFKELTAMIEGLQSGHNAVFQPNPSGTEFHDHWPLFRTNFKRVRASAVLVSVLAFLRSLVCLLSFVPEAPMASQQYSLLILGRTHHPHHYDHPNC